MINEIRARTLILFDEATLLTRGKQFNGDGSP